MGSAENQVFGNYSFKMEGLKGAEGGLKFFQADMCGGSVALSSVKAYSEAGPAVPLTGGGHQVTWNPISLTRYIDSDNSLYAWFEEVQEKGAEESTVQETKLTCLYNDQPLFMWTMTNAVVTDYKQNSANAQNHDLMTETVTLTYETAKMTR